MTIESIRRIAKYFALAVAFLTTGAPLFGQHKNFEIVGPGGGGAMFNATISPHNPSDVLVSCDMTGSYISHDGGRSWRMFNLRGVVRFFAFDPNHPGTIYAGTGPLWKSADAGESWQLVWPHPNAIRAIKMASDHADEQIVADDDSLGEFTALAIDPLQSERLIATTVKDGKAAVFSSQDVGRSWQKETDLSAPGQKIWIDPYSPKAQRNIYVGAEPGFTVRVGGKWQTRQAPENTRFRVVSAGFSKAGAVLYAASEHGIFVSKDGGISWGRPLIGGSRPDCRAIATSFRHPDVAYASCSNVVVQGEKYNGVVARTRDAGQSFEIVWKEGRVAPANVHDAWITDQLGVGWGEHPLTLTVAEDDPSLCYATDFGRTFISTDGGESWTGVYSKRVPRANWTSTGLDVTTNYGYFVDPFDAQRHFIAYTDIGLFRSDDGGRSWSSSAEGIPQEWKNTTYWLVFDPDVRGKTWGVMSGTHDLPRPKMWRRTSTSTYKGGVCVSTDGGRTWKASNTGMPETAPTHIVLDPSSAAGKRVLWVAAMGKGVYKSLDDGQTWTLKNRGIEQKDPLAWRLTRSADGTLYLLIARRSENGTISNSGDGAVYRSTDAAETWEPVKMPEGVNGPNGLASDPRDPKRLYLAAWARAAGTHGDGGGIFLSTDAGKTWKQVLDRDRHVYDVTIDPRDPGVLYAAGFESSAWRSVDRGEHWSRIGGFNFKWAHRVIPDPLDRNKVYITTFGGSVWHGSVNVANEPEDIATPNLRPGQ